MLTEATKQAIDNAMSKSNLKKIKLPAGTKIYSGPSDIHPVVITLKTEQKAYIIDTIYDDGWTHIMLPDNTEGYVNINKL